MPGEFSSYSYYQKYVNTVCMKRYFLKQILDESIQAYRQQIHNLKERLESLKKEKGYPDSHITDATKNITSSLEKSERFLKYYLKNIEHNKQICITGKIAEGNVDCDNYDMIWEKLKNVDLYDLFGYATSNFTNNYRQLHDIFYPPNL